ncbi:hypothetical protein ACIRQP_32815 [Streptomyces sp. NPDC102274]|uniref:hypothetical protein n=1 Tax=Streptomyces sp. NPDC102274 TaxID=3366151 RepID=UPI0038235932
MSPHPAAAQAECVQGRFRGFDARQHVCGENTAPDHPARHPTKVNLHDLVDIAIDTKVPIGDAVITMDGVTERLAAVSTFANAYALNALVLRAVQLLAGTGVEPPVWRSGNSPGGDEANARFLADFRSRVAKL